MILQNAELEDFRSHRHTGVDFHEGITVIIGENGSGKTTILEAVNFALFKQKPGSVSVDDLIRRGGTVARVSVTFTAGGRTYKVVRSRKKGRPSGSSLYAVGEGGESLLVQGEEEITREVEKLVGVDGDLFTSAVYIKQGEIDGLLGATAAVRKEQVGHLLGTQDIETAHQRMREIVREYEFRLKAFERVPQELVERKGLLDETKTGIRALEETLKEVTAGLEKEEKALAKALDGFNLLEKWKDLRSKKEKSAMAFNGHRERLEEIGSYEKTLEETREKEAEYHEVEKRLEVLRQDMEGYTRLEERLKSQEEALGRDKERLTSLEEGMKAALTKYSLSLEVEIASPEELQKIVAGNKQELGEAQWDLEERHRESSRRLADLRGRNREIERSLEELEQAGDICPVCESDLTPEHKAEVKKDCGSRIQENNDSIKKIEKELAGLDKKEVDLKRRAKELEDIDTASIGARAEEAGRVGARITEMEDIIKEVKVKLQEIGDPKAESGKLEAEKKSLEEAHEDHNAALRYLRRHADDKEGLRDESARLLEVIEDINKDITNAIDDLGYEPGEEDFARVKTEVGGLRTRVQDLQVARTRKDTERSGLMKRKEELETEMERLREEEKEAGRLKRFVTLLEDIRGLFHRDQLQKELRTQAVPIIERYTRELFDAFNLPYTDLMITDDFSMVLFGPGGEETVDMLSGGERIAAALALRLGIAKALTGRAGMDLIMLDEPTVHLDTARRQDLVEIIKRMSSIPQTIVVTHDKEFEQAADTLMVVEKVDGVSRVRTEG